MRRGASMCSSTFSKSLACSLVALFAFVAFGTTDARAKSIMAFAAPPVFLWTDESSEAQHIANTITEEYGVIHELGPGTFLGSGLPTNSRGHAWGQAGTDWDDQAIASTEGTHVHDSSLGGSSSGNGSSGNGSSARNDIDGSSSFSFPVNQMTTSLSIGGSLLADGPQAQDSNGLGDPDPDPARAVVIANPLPSAFPLFAGGLAGLGLLGWRRKRKAYKSCERSAL